MGDEGLEPAAEGGAPQGKPQGSGGKIAAILCGGCLLLMVLGGVGGYLAWQRGKALVLDVAATAVVEISRETFKGLQLPDADIDQAMPPIEAFAKQVREGQVSMGQALAVGRAISEGQVPALVMSRGFVVKHVKPSGLSEEEKQQGELAARRFAYGVSKDAIDRDERDKVMDMLTETVSQNVNGRQRTTKRFKKHLTDEELREVIAEMEQASDGAGVPADPPKVDLGAEIQQAIKKGMDNPIK